MMWYFLPEILLLITQNHVQQKSVYNLKLILYILINLKLKFKISCDSIGLGKENIAGLNCPYRYY